MYLPCVTDNLPWASVVPNDITFKFVTFIIHIDENNSISTIQLISTKTCTCKDITVMCGTVTYLGACTNLC